VLAQRSGTTATVTVTGAPCHCCRACRGGLCRSRRPGPSNASPGRGSREPPGRPRGVTLEFVVLAPVLLALIGLLIMAGRVAIASNSVEAAADEAPAAPRSRGRRPGARSAAQDGARRTLAAQDLRCSSVQVVVDTSGFAVPVGLPAQVRPRWTCVVALGDLALPGFPGSRTVSATAVSPWTPIGSADDTASGRRPRRRHALRRRLHRHPARRDRPRRRRRRQGARAAAGGRGRARGGPRRQPDARRALGRPR
jgi:hypothetical protein